MSLLAGRQQVESLAGKTAVPGTSTSCPEQHLFPPIRASQNARGGEGLLREVQWPLPRSSEVVVAGVGPALHVRTSAIFSYGTSPQERRGHRRADILFFLEEFARFGMRTIPLSSEKDLLPAGAGKLACQIISSPRPRGPGNRPRPRGRDENGK